MGSTSLPLSFWIVVRPHYPTKSFILQPSLWLHRLYFLSFSDAVQPLTAECNLSINWRPPGQTLALSSAPLLDSCCQPPLRLCLLTIVKKSQSIWEDMLLWREGTLEQVHKCKQPLNSHLHVIAWKPPFKQSTFCLNVYKNVSYSSPR